MFKKIAEILNLPYNDKNIHSMGYLQTIANDITPLDENLSIESPVFAMLVTAADKKRNERFVAHFGNMANILTSSEPPKELKIKSSPKGERIKIAASNGIHYSFGPIWNESVKRGKGIAFVESNRQKLNHQGMMVGVETPELLSVIELSQQIAKNI